MTTASAASAHNRAAVGLIGRFDLKVKGSYHHGGEESIGELPASGSAHPVLCRFSRSPDQIRLGASDVGLSFQYDIVAIVDAKNDQALTAFGLVPGSAGNVRAQTLRAFKKSEFGSIVGKLP
jgi:hypothetical protein